MSARQLAELMYSIADSWDVIFDSPWNEMRHPAYDADLANNDVIPQDAFLSIFDSFLKTGTHFDIITQRAKN